MLLLVSTSDKIQVVTGVAAAVDVHASYVDYDGTTVTPGRKNTAISTAATTDVVASPASSTNRSVKALTIRNKDAVAVAVTVKHTDGSITVELCKVTLHPEQTLVYLDGAGFFVPGDPGVRAASYSTSDQAVGASATDYLAGSAIAIAADHLIKVGTVFRWRVGLTKTAAGTLACSFDVRFGTAGTTSDTSRANFSTGTQTGAVDAAWVEIHATVRGPIGASCVVEFIFTLWHNLTTTGFSNAQNALVARASATFDVTTAGLIVGLSLTTAASYAITVQTVMGEALNI